MIKEGCPGSAEIRNPYPEDLECYFCSALNEIWSDEPDTTCRGCRHTIARDLKASCLMWCPAAKECVGADKYERLIKAMKD